MEKLHIVLRATSQPGSLKRPRLLMAAGGLYQNWINASQILAAHPGMPRNVVPTRMEEAPKAALDIHCLQRGGGAALTQTINLIPPLRGDGGTRALMAWAGEAK